MESEYMGDKITKSRITTEKGGILAAAMALISLGVGVLTNCSQHISCTWEFAFEVTFAIGLIALGFLMLKIREYLKLNRWHDKEIEEDYAPLQRFISRCEGNVPSGEKPWYSFLIGIARFFVRLYNKEITAYVNKLIDDMLAKADDAIKAKLAEKKIRNAIVDRFISEGFNVAEAWSKKTCENFIKKIIAEQEVD